MRKSKSSKSLSMVDNGYFLISGDITNDLSFDLITWIVESNFNDINNPPYDNLTLMINSDGGSLECAFAIIDAIRDSYFPVYTVGLGQVSSSALMIFMAGKSGHRKLYPNTNIISHQYSTKFDGKAHEFASTYTNHNLVSKRMLDHYQKCTGLDPEFIKEKLLPAHDVFLTPEEALKFNICDHIAKLN